MCGSEYRRRIGGQSPPVISVFVCFLSLCAAPVFNSAHADESTLDVMVDLRAGASVPEDYTIVFCARDASLRRDKSVGHAFVVWGFNDDERRACVADAFGFFPEKDGDIPKSVVANVPGELSASAFRNKPGSGECRLLVKVTKEQWSASESIQADWAKRKYRLAKKDCVTFAAAVAKELK